MNDKSLVSVIIPTYKRPENLKYAIKNVKKQTYSNIEIIIVDDNEPNDIYRKKTKEVVSSYTNKRIIYIEHNKNKGACAARNNGIKKAKGKYIAFLDDDDTWEETKISKQIDLISRDKDLGLVFCNFEYMSTSKKTKFEFKEPIFIELLKKSGGISTSTFLARSSVIKELNGFDISLPSNQDYDLLLRVAQISKIDFRPEVLMFYNDYTQGITQNYKNKLMGREIIIEKYKDSYYDLNIEKFLYKQYEIAAHMAIMTNNKEKAIQYLQESLKFKNKFKNKIKKYVITFGGKPLYEFIIEVKNLFKY